MRILLLSTSMGMGGADKQLLSAAQVLRSRGHDIMIVALVALGPMGLEARRMGIRTESLEIPRGYPDPRGLVRLLRLARAWKPDVLHSHMIHANLLARALRLFLPIPVVVATIHSLYEGGPLWMWAYRLSHRLVDGMTIVSQAAADRYIKEGIVPRELLRVVPNGVDLERYSTLPPGARATSRASLRVDDQFVWLAVGRFAVPKDYPTMLRAFREVVAQQPRAMLLVVGEGPLQRETEALVRELRLGENVRFLGVRHDIPELMAAADGYLMSSAWEGMPMVLLEAAAAGLPIVATRVGGNHELVREGESGFLAPARDPSALAAAALRLMTLSQEERQAMGRRGREHVRANYSLDRVAEQWERLYREVAARKAPAPARLPPEAEEPR
jgi:glycosyltransferase involved in cell wall biosynthesis